MHVKLNIQLFGGRGSKSSLKKLPKNKQKSVDTFKKRIKQHEEKIKKALNDIEGHDRIYIPHWEHEINVFKNNIEKIERKYRK